MKSSNEFMVCPYCNKRPKIKIYEINYGRAYCKGTLFHWHPHVDTGWTDYCAPSQLYEILKHKWEDKVYEAAKEQTEWIREKRSKSLEQLGTTQMPTNMEEKEKQS